MMPRRYRLLSSATLLAGGLCACSLTFNWREVPIGPDGLIALLPCKPDRATRALPIGVESVSVEMAGCEAGGATFAVAHASASSMAQAETWMRAWRAATRTQLAGVSVTEAMATVPRAAVSPTPARLEIAAAPGKQEPAQMLWFAQQHPGSVSLYQATVLGRPSSPEALPTFFEGLRLP